MKVAARIAQRTKGRPRGQGRTVADDLILATEQFILEKGHARITEKEIAERAASSDAMIHYYFGSRQGLLFCVVDKAAREQGERLKELESDLESISGNPTLFLVQQLITIYAAQPVLTRLTVSECMQPDSLIRDEFLKHYGDRSVIVLQRILDRLVERGLYSGHFDTRHAAFSLLSLATSHLVLDPLMKNSSHLSRDPSGWVKHLVDLLDRQFTAHSTQSL